MCGDGIDNSLVVREYKDSQGKDHFISSYQRGSKRRHHRTITIPSYGSVPATSLQSGTNTIQFKITPGSLGLVRKVGIQYTCNNSDGVNPVTPVMAPYFASAYQAYCDAGSTLAQTIPDDVVLSNLNLESNEVLASRVTLMNMNTSGAGQAAIGTSATISYYVPLPGLWIEDMYLGGLKSEITIKVLLRGSVSAGSGTINVGSAGIQLLIEEETLSEGEKIRKAAEYTNKGNVYHKKFLDYVFDQRPSETLTASVAKLYRTSNFVGKAAWIQANFRASVAVASQAISTFTALGTVAAEGTIELKDPSGNTLSGTALQSNYLRLYDAPEHFKGQLLSSIPLYYLIHGEPELAIKGVMEGWMEYSPDHQIVLTPGSAFASGTFVVTFIMAKYRQIVIENGLCRVEDL